MNEVRWLAATPSRPSTRWATRCLQQRGLRRQLSRSTSCRTSSPRTTTGATIPSGLPLPRVNRIDLQVFNRWGQVVFTTEDPDIGWNGTHRDTNRTRAGRGVLLRVPGLRGAPGGRAAARAHRQRRPRQQQRTGQLMFTGIVEEVGEVVAVRPGAATCTWTCAPA